MKALLVIDMLNEYIYDNEDERLIDEDQREPLISNIKKVIELAHKKKYQLFM